MKSATRHCHEDLFHCELLTQEDMDVLIDRVIFFCYDGCRERIIGHLGKSDEVCLSRRGYAYGSWVSEVIDKL